MTALASLLVVLVLSAGTLALGVGRDDRAMPLGSAAPTVAPGLPRELQLDTIKVQAPQGWFVVAYTPVVGADGQLQSSGGVQLTNFDPGNADRPICEAGGNTLPPDGVAMIVAETGLAGDGSSPEWPVSLTPEGAGPCDGASTTARWGSSVSGLAYTAHVRVGPDADAAAAGHLREAFSSLSFAPPADALGIDLMTDGATGPIAALASGVAGTRPWSLVAYASADNGLSLDLLGGNTGIGNVHGTTPSDVTLDDALFAGNTVLFGAVDSTASSLLVRDGGEAVVAAPVPMPGWLSDHLQAFAVSVPGAPRGELEVDDQTGHASALRWFYPQAASYPGNLLLGDTTPIRDGDTIVTLGGAAGGGLVYRNGKVVLESADGSVVASAAPPSDGALSFAHGRLETANGSLEEYFGITSPEVTAVRLDDGHGGAGTDALLRALPDGSSVYFLGFSSTATIPPLTGSLVAIDAQCHVAGSLSLDTGLPDPNAHYPECAAG